MGCSGTKQYRRIHKATQQQTCRYAVGQANRWAPKVQTYRSARRPNSTPADGREWKAAMFATPRRLVVGSGFGSLVMPTHLTENCCWAITASKGISRVLDRLGKMYKNNRLRDEPSRPPMCELESCTRVGNREDT